MQELFLLGSSLILPIALLLSAMMKSEIDFEENLIENHFQRSKIYFLKTNLPPPNFLKFRIMTLNHVKDTVFELYTKFGFLKISLASKFDNDHQKKISKSTSASKFMSDLLSKNQNSFPDTAFVVFFVNPQYDSQRNPIQSPINHHHHHHANTRAR